MTTSIDVLAVMDDAANVLFDEGGAVTAYALEQARAAVAELIEAVNAAAFNATPLRLNDHQTCIRVKPDYWDSILSALARVKGAQP